MSGTVSPDEVFQKDSSDAEPLSFYFALDFPDFRYCAKKLNIVVGRSDDGDKFAKNDEESNLVAEDTAMPRGRKRDLDDFEDDVVFESKTGRTESKRVKLAASNEEDSDWSSSMDDVPQHSTRTNITAVGGVGGPQPQTHDIDDDTAFVGVHPEVDEYSGENPFYSISKRHLLIEWDNDQGWAMQILGRNGAFLNEVHYAKDQAVRLEHLDVITLKNLGFTFCDARHMQPDESHSDLSDMDDSDEELDEIVESVTTPSDDEEDDNEDANDTMLDGVHEVIHKPAKLIIRKPKVHTNDDVEGDEGDDEGDEVTEPKTPTAKHKTQKIPRKLIKLTVQTPKGKGKTIGKGLGKGIGKSVGKGTGDKELAPNPEKFTVSQTPADSQDAVASVEAPQRKRGPGRPPADGIMSKRERKERERADQAGIAYGEPLPEKVKSRPRTGSKDTGNSAEAEAGVSAKKNKKPKAESSGPNDADEERNDSKSPKNEPTPEPSRSPSPKESDYPPEALVKPDDTYQGLLYTVLSEAKGPLALPQIYKAIKNKWPHYRFSKETKGWESSVRHNLQSCPCFEKAGKAGKGFMWIIDPKVPFERKSKRADPSNSGPSAYQAHKATMMSHQAMHQPIHGLGTHPYAYPQGYPAANVQQVSFANGQRPQPIQNLQHQPPFNGLPIHSQPPRPLQLVNGQHPPLPPHQNLPPHNPQVQPSTNYSSPYAPNLGPQPLGTNMQNSPMMGQSRPSTATSMANGVTPGRQVQHLPHQSPLQRLPSANGAQSVSNPQHQRLNSPAVSGQNPPRSGGQPSIEPPADVELRAGRMPAVVRRFLAQLRKMSGVNHEQTIKSAEVAVQWILKYPASDEGLDREMAEFGAPKSMINVIRNLVVQQSQSSLEQSAALQHDSVPSIGSNSRPNSYTPMHTAVASVQQTSTPGKQMTSQAQMPVPAPTVTATGTLGMSNGQPARIDTPGPSSQGVNVVSRLPGQPTSGHSAAAGSTPAVGQQSQTNSPAPASTPVDSQQPGTSVHIPAAVSGSFRQNVVASAPTPQSTQAENPTVPVTTVDGPSQQLPLEGSNQAPIVVDVEMQEELPKAKT